MIDMMYNYLFSIIVPVYNVEKYIDRCLDSLINQTYKNIEVILINDGSTDNSTKICDTYSRKYNFIHTFHKKNGGLSDARNYGLKRASGEYIVFLDSDDYIDIDSCYKFNEILNNYDDVQIIAGNIKKIYDKKSINQVYTISENITSGKDFLTSQLKNKTMYVSACRNVYNKAFLLNNRLLFKKGIYHEDEHWTPRVFLNSKKVVVTNIIFYNHMIREGSITQQKSKRKNAKDLIQICKELSNIYQLIEDNELKNYLFDYLTKLYLHAIFIGKFNDTEEVIDKEFLKEHSKSIENKIKVRLLLINKNLFYSYTYVRLNFLNRKMLKHID